MKWLLICAMCLPPISSGKYIGDGFMRYDRQGGRIFEAPLYMEMACDGTWSWNQMCDDLSPKLLSNYELYRMLARGLGKTLRSFLKNDVIQADLLLRMKLAGKPDIIVDCAPYEDSITCGIVFERYSVKFCLLSESKSEDRESYQVRYYPYDQFNRFMRELDVFITNNMGVRFRFLLQEKCRLSDYWDFMASFFHRHYRRTSLLKSDIFPAKKIPKPPVIPWEITPSIQVEL